MSNATQSRQLKSTLGDLLRSLEDGEKTANLKTAAAIKPAGLKKKADEPETSHPSGSADDGTQPYPEGSHAAANEATVKEDQPLGIPAATPNDSGSQNDVQVDMGLTSKTTGTDPGVEKDVKDRPEDPGTSSDVDTSIGEKYSSQRSQLDQLVKTSEATGSTFLAILNKLAGTEAPAAPAAAPPAAKVNGEKTAAKDVVAGYELAGALSALPPADQNAMLGGIQGVLREEIKSAVDMATKTAEYLIGIQAGIKQAEGEGGPPDQPPPEEGSEGNGGGPPASDNGDSGGGGAPPPEGGGGDGGGGLSEQDLIQLLMQGDQMPPADGGGGMGGGLGGMGGDMGGGGGGLEALLAGGGGGGPPPDAGGGGMPPDAGGGMPPDAGGAGGAGGDINPQMLEAILQEIGANPEQLEKAMAAKNAAVRVKAAQQNRSKFGPKYDQVKKAVADLLGRKVA